MTSGKKMSRSGFLLATILMAYLPGSTHAHGRMTKPWSRQSGYLAGLGMPANYNDHEMNCGGREVQWDQSGGKCGICGEPYPGKKNYERPNGIMVQHNIITGEYMENEGITIRLQITVSHKGYHEFRICNVRNSGGIEATQACLNRTLLADEFGKTRFTEGTTSTGFFDYHLVLPEGLTCELCVLQWKWKAGNDWGCSDGLCCVGCGDRQEEFYACADIRISPRGTRYPTTWPTVTRSTTRPPTTWRYPATTWRYTYPTTRAPPVTYQPSIATTRKTTPKPTSSYFYYPIYEYFKRYPYNYTPGGTSIKFPGSGNNNNNNNTPRNSIIAFQDLIIGRNAEIVTRDGLSVPIPMSYNNTSPADADIIKDYLTRDRYCAACDNGCPFDRCSTFCPHICSISYLGSNQS